MSDDAKIPVEVHPVDVGQGDCFLVVFKEVKEPTNDDGQRGDYVIMIDGGVQWRSEYKEERLKNDKILRKLDEVETKLRELSLIKYQESGPHKLMVDLIVATHADREHYDGIHHLTKHFDYSNYIVCSEETFDDLINGDDQIDRTQSYSKEKQMFQHIRTLDNNSLNSLLPDCLENKIQFLSPGERGKILYLKKKIEFDENGKKFSNASVDENNKQLILDIIEKRYHIKENKDGSYDATTKEEKDRIRKNGKSNSSLITLAGNLDRKKNLLVFTGDNSLVDIDKVLSEYLEPNDSPGDSNLPNKFQDLTVSESNCSDSVSTLTDEKVQRKEIWKNFSNLKYERSQNSVQLLQVPHHGSSYMRERDHENTLNSIFPKLLKFYKKFPASRYLVSAANLYGRREGKPRKPGEFIEDCRSEPYEVSGQEPVKAVFGHPHPSTVISILLSIMDRASDLDSVQIYTTNSKALTYDGSSVLNRNKKLDTVFWYCLVSAGSNGSSSISSSSAESQGAVGGDNGQGDAGSSQYPKNNKVNKVPSVEFFHVIGQSEFLKYCTMFRADSDALWNHEPSAETTLGVIKLTIDKN